MADYTLRGTRVSMAFFFANKIGNTIDLDPFNGGVIDIAAQDVIRLMDRNFPDVSRQITFNPAQTIVPDGYQIGGADTFDVDANNQLDNGRVTMDFDYDSDTYAARHNFALDYHIQSQPLKKGKHYFEIHVNSITQRTNGIGQNLTFTPTNWNLEPAIEASPGRTAFFDFNDRDMAGIINSGTYQWTSDSAGADTKAGDIFMVAYDTNANSTDEGRVFFGYNGEWGHPTDSSTMIDLNPANYDSADTPSGNGGVGIPILTKNTNVGGARPAQVAGYESIIGDLNGYFWSVGFHPQGLLDGAGDSSGSIDVTIKVGTDITYTVPTGFKAH